MVATTTALRGTSKFVIKILKVLSKNYSILWLIFYAVKKLFFAKTFYVKLKQKTIIE